MDSQVTASRLHGQVASYLADFAGQAGATRDVLEPDHKLNPDLDAIANKLWSGEAHLNDLGQGYKLAPHAPPALLFKYIVHRVKNLEGYDAKASAHTLDHAFFREHSTGGAFSHHTKISPRHLNEWLSLNPQLVDETLHNRDNLQEMAKRGIGLNVRTINAEPHVAVTRGLDTVHVGPEHALSSFSDLPHSGFGRHQHRMWIPLKDLWYGFPTAPAVTRGDHGHENEWLFTHGGPRYSAHPEDVHTSWTGFLEPLHFAPEGNVLPGAIPAIPYDNIDPAMLEADASALTLNQLAMLHARNRMGPKAYAEYRRRGAMAESVADLPYMQAGEANALAMHQLERGDRAILAFHNPNLTSGDLVNIVSHPNFIPKPDLEQTTFRNYLRSLVRNPSFNTDVADKLMARIEDGNMDKHAVLLAQHSPVPVKNLHRFFLGALNAGDNVSFSPEFAIAKAFHDPDASNPVDVPAAFNNSNNTEQYLKALALFFKQNPDEAEDAHNVYHLMLTGARMSDTLAAHLVDLSKAATPLPGIDLTAHDELLEEIARFNEQLSPRTMLQFVKSESGRKGLLQRDNLPASVQLAVADNIDDDEQVALLTNRNDLAPEAADALLFQAQNLDGQTVDADDLVWVGRRVASNLTVPMHTIEKHLTQDAKNMSDKYSDEQEVPASDWTRLSPLEQGLLEGVFNRKAESGEHIVHPLPAGALS